MYLVDTPGVLPPRLGDVETGMKLALCGELVARGSPQMWPLGLVPKAGVTLLLTIPECEGVEGGLAGLRSKLGLTLFSRSHPRPPGGGGRHGRLPPVHPEQAAAVRVSHREVGKAPRRVLEMPSPGNSGGRRWQRGVRPLLWQVRAVLRAGPALRPPGAPAQAHGPGPGPHAEGEGADRHRWVLWHCWGSQGSSRLC